MARTGKKYQTNNENEFEPTLNARTHVLMFETFELIVFIDRLVRFDFALADLAPVHVQNRTMTLVETFLHRTFRVVIATVIDLLQCGVRILLLVAFVHISDDLVPILVRRLLDRIASRIRFRMIRFLDELVIGRDADLICVQFHQLQMQQSVRIATERMCGCFRFDVFAQLKSDHLIEWLIVERKRYVDILRIYVNHHKVGWLFEIDLNFVLRLTNIVR